MSECCYVCTEPITDGDPVYVLREDDGTKWLVHDTCMSKMEKVNGQEATP